MVTKPNQNVTVDAFLTPKTTGHFQPSVARASQDGLLLKGTTIGWIHPFVKVNLFGVGTGFVAPYYYFTFSQGKLTSINVMGSSDNSWPIYEMSAYN